MEKKLFITDDHAMIRNGIAGWFNKNTDWICVGSAGSMNETLNAFELLSGMGNLPAILITDINMEGVHQGFNLMEQVKAKYPSIKCVAYSMYVSPGMVQKSLKAGADGYISKTSDEKELLQCVEDVFSGNQHIAQELMMSLCSYNNVISALTKREMQVFDQILQRKSNLEISEALNLKRHAVENYISFIYEKTGCTDRTDLIHKFGEKLGENS